MDKGETEVINGVILIFFSNQRLLKCFQNNNFRKIFEFHKKNSSHERPRLRAFCVLTLFSLTGHKKSKSFGNAIRSIYA